MKNELGKKANNEYLLRIASNSSWLPESKNQINEFNGLIRLRTDGLYENERELERMQKAQNMLDDELLGN